MAKLVLSMDGLVLKEIPLTKERTSIGRKPHNDIQIDNLAISGEHATIVSILNDAFLEDLNSTNGTYVNGQPVKKLALKDGDIVELGKYRLKFLRDTAPDFSAKSTFEKAFVTSPEAAKLGASSRAHTETMLGFSGESSMVDNGPTVSSAWAPPSSSGGVETQPPGVNEPLGVIQIISGRNAGRELQLSKSLTTLGKPGTQVAVITRRPHGYFITHVEGDAFPILNGKQLDAQAHLLADRDVFEIAGVKMCFYLRPATQG
ncbi:FHA domain-containing protein [Uliginosibacterium gangwonense]|uniref:FHA domain-containing protein n=1 Tax=Uliginosibacterium gangwonense TaxID=392736 RepID=UPI0003A8A2CB|nr:FHA domain-containing protein [Uliginosibacterium gangwonense]